MFVVYVLAVWSEGESDTKTIMKQDPDRQTFKNCPSLRRVLRAAGEAGSWELEEAEEAKVGVCLILPNRTKPHVSFAAALGV